MYQQWSADFVSDDSDGALEKLLERNQSLQNIVWPSARQRTSQSNTALRKRVDKHRKEASFAPGDMVMIKRAPRASKDTPAYRGPFTILAPDPKIKTAFQLLDESGHLHPTSISTPNLKLISEAEQAEEFDVEEIVGSRALNGRPVEYEVKWKGYPDTTWEPESSFVAPDGTITEALQIFRDQNNPPRHSLRPRRSNSSST